MKIINIIFWPLRIPCYIFLLFGEIMILILSGIGELFAKIVFNKDERIFKNCLRDFNTFIKETSEFFRVK